MKTLIFTIICALTFFIGTAFGVAFVLITHPIMGCLKINNQADKDVFRIELNDIDRIIDSGKKYVMLQLVNETPDKVAK